MFIRDRRSGRELIDTLLTAAQREQRRVADDLTLLIDTANAPIFGIDADGKVNESHQIGRVAASSSNGTHWQTKPIIGCCTTGCIIICGWQAEEDHPPEGQPQPFH